MSAAVMDSFTEAATRAADSVAKFMASLDAVDAAIHKAQYERCDYSWLYVSQCGHCLGHVADWEETPGSRVYGE